MRAFRSHALLLRTVPYGETDLILTLLTETDGKLGASLRGGRRSSKRSSGGVEPFHTLDVLLEERSGELLSLKETRLLVVRERLVASLDAMEAGGLALRWARHLFPNRQTEPRGFRTLLDLLDALNAPDPRALPKALLAVAGLKLLASVGYALELDRCVVCGRPCPESAPAYVQAARGGIVCRACGGGGRLLDGRSRELARECQANGPPLMHDGDEADAGDETDRAAPLTAPAWLDTTHAETLLALVQDVMAAHTGLDPSK